MSEVDRLSNSGLYPALPISDRRSDGKSAGQGPAGHSAGKEKSAPSAESTTATPRPPKSLIDEYA
jgi:hypothetical protein